MKWEWKVYTEYEVSSYFTIFIQLFHQINEITQYVGIENK